MTKYHTPVLVSVIKIWDNAPHNAFTDLILYKNQWFCAFREANAHEKKGNGLIRIITSREGVMWTSASIIEIEGLDLRDPKLSVRPDGALMLSFCGIRLDHQQKYQWWQSLAAFSNDGIDWGPVSELLPRNEWLWRLTWNKGIAYGVSYRFSDLQDPNKEWYSSLWESENGITFTKLTDFELPGRPNEATIRFTDENEAICLLRNNKKPNRRAWIGISSFPYREWDWLETIPYFSSPNFLILPDNSMIASGRIMYPTPYTMNERVTIAKMNLTGVSPALLIPSTGDSGYPGMVYDKGFIWISYYTSFKGKSGIYLAKVYV